MRGRLALRVACCFPDPSRSPWLHCLTPSPFPNLLRLCAVPLSLTLRHQGWRLPTSQVTHGLMHPHLGSHAGHFPGCAQACAPSPSTTRVTCCFFHPPQGCPPCHLNPHCWERGGSLAEWMGACTHTRLLCPQLGEVGSGAACTRGRCVGGTLHPCREEGVSTTPCIVPRARPLHAPPLDATMHMPGTQRWGMQGSCMQDGTRGCAHMQWGRGSTSLWRPCFLCRPWVVRGPNEDHGVGEKGEGRGSPRRAFAWHPCMQKEGGVPATSHPSSQPLPFSSVCAPLLIHTQMGVPPSPHPVHTGREGQKWWWRWLLCSLCCSGEWSQGRGAYLCVVLCIPHLRTEAGWCKPHT